jgi:methionyl-tRNA formyltransferase
VTAASGRPVRTRTVFIGSGGFAVPVLRASLGHPGIDLVAVVTAPPRPAGRRGELASTPVARAVPPPIQILTPARLRAPGSLAELGALRPELALLADYGQIVPAPLLELRHGALNLHPSLLPRYRGASPIAATILAGDQETGVTLMRMDAGLDTGDIVASERVTLTGDENAPGLEDRLAALAADLLERSLAPWLAGALAPRPQPVSGATMTRPLRREDGRLDPRRTAVELERQVRAYQPWPGSFVELAGVGRLVVWAASAADTSPGEVATSPTMLGTVGPHGLATAAGRLVLDEVQPAGGRRMPWADFVRGRPSVIGASIVG